MGHDTITEEPMTIADAVDAVLRTLKGAGRTWEENALPAYAAGGGGGLGSDLKEGGWHLVEALDRKRAHRLLQSRQEKDRRQHHADAEQRPGDVAWRMRVESALAEQAGRNEAGAGNRRQDETGAGHADTCVVLEFPNGPVMRRRSVMLGTLRCGC